MANALKLLKKTAEDMAWPEDIQVLMVAGYIAQTMPDLDQEKFTNATTDFSVNSTLGGEFTLRLLCKLVEDIEKSAGPSKKWKDFLVETVTAFEAEMKAQQPEDPQLPFPPDDPSPPSASTPQSELTTVPVVQVAPVSTPVSASSAPVVAEKPKFQEIEINIPVPQLMYDKAAAVLKKGKQLPDRLIGEVLFQFMAMSPQDQNIKLFIDVVNGDQVVSIDPYLKDGKEIETAAKPGFDLDVVFVFHYKETEYKVKLVPR